MRTKILRMNYFYYYVNYIEKTFNKYAMSIWTISHILVGELLLCKTTSTITIFATIKTNKNKNKPSHILQYNTVYL